MRPLPARPLKAAATFAHSETAGGLLRQSFGMLEMSGMGKLNESHHVKFRLREC